MDKPTLPKGTRDFGPAQMAKRHFILGIIQTVFRKYGFQPLETPAMENLSTLTGKYGDEGDQLLFKVLDSGDFAQAVRNSVNEFKHIEGKIRYEFNSAFLTRFNELRGVKNPSGDGSIEFQLRIQSNDEIAKQFSEQLILKNKSTIEQSLQHALKQDHFIAAYTISNNLYSNLIGPYIQNLDLLFDPKNLSKDISQKGLRYDLTVPFARYVVMNRGELTLPFKRFQIQPVWRADRPQKGRYREFYQCDADVVGTDSLVSEAEIVLMIKEVFQALGISNYSIKINHRDILSGLAEIAGNVGNEGALFVAIDKLDKIGEDKVSEELETKGFTKESISRVFQALKTSGSNDEKLSKLQSLFAQSKNGNRGISELNTAFEILKHYGSTQSNVEFDISLARGLSYYTGTIFEVKVNNVSIGSVSGGGRYDNLTQAFGAKEKLSGVGISFGIDRIYDVMEELNLFPKETIQFTKVLIVHMDEASMNFGFRVAQSLRVNNIATEIYPDLSKVKKQLDYANKKQIPFAVIVGPDEMAAGHVALKNLTTGDQENLDLNTLIDKLK